MSAGVELLIDGDLICLACQLVDPLCERGTIVACEAKSVSLIDVNAQSWKKFPALII